MSARRIAVVGAGIAGLTAARALASAGCDVVVFDKGRGVGGRTATRRHEGDAFDHGAQYFTCRTEAFRLQVDEWCSRRVAAAWLAPVLTLGSRMPRGHREPAPRYVGVPGMSALARDLAERVRVECGQRVERIARRSARWELEMEHGPWPGRFDAVVAATPAPQAVPLLASAPRLAERVGDVAMHPCHAVMARFAAPLQLDFGGAFVVDSPLAWVARNASKPRRPGGECWVLHATPEWSVHHLEAPAETVSRNLLRAFAEALGQGLPEPAYRTAHRWRFARTDAPLAGPPLWDADAQLGACGDWTHGARVEDAFTSGAELARAMLGASAAQPSASTETRA